MARFPQDCHFLDCPYYSCDVVSIDPVLHDIIVRCDILHIETFDRNQDYTHHQCPLSEEQRKEYFKINIPINNWPIGICNDCFQLYIYKEDTTTCYFCNGGTIYPLKYDELYRYQKRKDFYDSQIKLMKDEL